MVTPAGDDIDLCKIAGYSISGWIPGFLLSLNDHVLEWQLWAEQVEKWLEQQQQVPIHPGQL
jgi:hypothetical protein